MKKNNHEVVIRVETTESDYLDVEEEDINTFYLPVQCIAEGGFGKVYECINLKTKARCAVKVIDKNRVKQSKVDNLKAEVHILQSINHDNIVKLQSFRETRTSLLLEMELIEYGTLGKFLKERTDKKQSITTEEIATIMKAILTGLAFLHSKSIIHRDLKTENILVCDPQDLSKIKIADFGLSVQMNPNSFKPWNHCGTLLYMAPEVLRKHPYTRSVDIWSCAVILYLLFQGGQHPLISTKPRPTKSQDYLSQIHKPWPPLRDPLAQSLIQRMNRLDPIERYSAAEAIRHPFITRNLDDIIPLTYNESFKGFEICRQTAQFIKLSTALLTCMNDREQADKTLVVSRQYLAKVEEYNEKTIQAKERILESKSASRRRILSSNEGNTMNSSQLTINLGGTNSVYSVTNASALSTERCFESFESESSPKKSSPCASRKTLKLTNISFADELIKIKDAREQKLTTAAQGSKELPRKLINRPVLEINTKNILMPNADKIYHKPHDQPFSAKVPANSNQTSRRFISTNNIVINDSSSGHSPMMGNYSVVNNADSIGLDNHSSGNNNNNKKSTYSGSPRKLYLQKNSIIYFPKLVTMEGNNSNYNSKHSSHNDYQSNNNSNNNPHHHPVRITSTQSKVMGSAINGGKSNNISNKYRPASVQKGDHRPPGNSQHNNNNNNNNNNNIMIKPQQRIQSSRKYRSNKSGPASLANKQVTIHNNSNNSNTHLRASPGAVFRGHNNLSKAPSN